MGAWAAASLFIVSLLCINCNAYRENFHQKQQTLPGTSRPEVYFAGSAVPDLQSASDLQSPNRLRLSSTDYLLGRATHDQNVPLGNPNFYETFNKHFGRNLEQARSQRYSVSKDTNDRTGLEDHALTDNYGDYKTSQSTHSFGPQIENIQSEHYHAKVEPFDVSSFNHEHHEKEKHGEVHYHEHKHVHKHEHKQEHKHHHKQEHEHKHMHDQHHEHKHHQEHKHGHEHKHNHHQDHKHDHHHDHKHDAHHDHEHKHKHGHKHEHHNDHKHHHKHGHKHEHKHGHKHHSKHHSKHHY